MSYATQSDMVERFGELDLIQLTDRADPPAGVIDAGVVQTALDDASSEIDGYLSGRYTLPLSPVPTVLVGFCCDIARYKLNPSVDKDHPASQRYRDAVVFLGNLSRGVVSLGVAGLETNKHGRAVIVAPSRRFTRETLQ